MAEGERDARISKAEAEAKEVELRAGADAKRVKLEADASAERTRLLGQAEADATTVRGDAEGSATKARGLAEAQAIEARAKALAQNQEAVINQQIAEELPRIVAEGAKAFGNIGQLTVLNGAQGVGEILTQVIAGGVAALPALRGLLNGPNGKPADGEPAKKDD